MRTVIKMCLILVALAGCSWNKGIVKGTYYHGTIFDTETLTFLDSTHFTYSYASDGGSRTVGKGIYKIIEDQLILNFEIRGYNNQFVYVSIDSSDTEKENILCNIIFQDYYTKRLLHSGIISIYDLNNAIILKDTCDNNGHLRLNLHKSDNIFTFRTSFKPEKNYGTYIPLSFSVGADKDYRITVFSVTKSEGNIMDGEIIVYDILGSTEGEFIVRLHNTKKNKIFKLAKNL